MTFEVFDRDRSPSEPVVEEPLVRVDEGGRLLFNRPAWAFLAMQVLPGAAAEVVLLFDAESRTVGVQPAEVGVRAPAASTRWPAMQMRSQRWPRAVTAPEFVQHYQVVAGEYRAQLMRSPGPRMVTFQVATSRVAPRVAPIVGEYPTRDGQLVD